MEITRLAISLTKSMGACSDTAQRGVEATFDALLQLKSPEKVAKAHAQNQEENRGIRAAEKIARQRGHGQKE